MGIPYRARVNERWFLNLPGFHGGAYVVAYVEAVFGATRTATATAPTALQLRAADDPRDRGLQPPDQSRVRGGLGGGSCELAAQARHLLSALRIFRAGVEAEFEHYDRRERELRELKRE